MPFLRAIRAIAPHGSGTAFLRRSQGQTSSVCFAFPILQSVARYHGTSIHVDHAMSTGNQSVNGRRWSRWNGGADGNTPNGFLIFEKIFTGFVGPPSPSTLCAGPAYPHRSIQPGMNQWERAARGARADQPGSAAARGALPSNRENFRLTSHCAHITHSLIRVCYG